MKTAGEGTGAKTVSATYESNEDLAGSAHTYTGVDQTTPAGGAVSRSKDSDVAEYSINVTSETGDLVIGFCLAENGHASNEDIAPGSGQTERARIETWGDQGMSASDEAGASTVAHSYISDNGGTIGNALCLHALNLNAAAVGTDYTKGLTETVTMVDSVAFQTDRTFSEAIALVDNVAFETGRKLTEVVTLVDNFSASRTLVRVFSEVATFVDSFSYIKISNYFTTLTETMTLVDSFAYDLVSQMRKGITVLMTKTVDKINMLTSKLGGTTLGTKGKDGTIVATESKDIHSLKTKNRDDNVL